jgi:hypothetical protein
VSALINTVWLMQRVRIIEQRRIEAKRGAGMEIIK